MTTPRRNWRVRIIGTSLAVAVIVVSATGCGTPSTRKPVDLSVARVLGGHEAIVIDGQLSSRGEWRDAVGVPFEPGGRAHFLWDEDGIYVRLQNNRPPPDGPEEALCISLYGGSPGLILLIRGDHQRGRKRGVRLAEVRTKTVCPVSSFRTSASGHGDKDIRFVSRSAVAKRGMPWEAEMVIPWESITRNGTPGSEMFIHLYRVIIERPTSVLKMEKQE